MERIKTFSVPKKKRNNKTATENLFFLNSHNLVFVFLKYECTVIIFFVKTKTFLF
jgi:hypothetical protein